MQSLAYIPSPSDGVWHLGPLPIRAYALMIILGIVVAVWLSERRWIARGGTPNVVVDVAVWAVPFGLVGGRLYHVITDYQRYFGQGKDPVDALKIWQGGLGIWGAIALGGVGAWIGCRRRGISIASFADALAPGIALAQAIGRWGNWWNQELYGRPLDTWWAVKIDTAHRPRDPRYADIATYHPTFLYESLWCAGVAIFVIWAGRRFKLTHGRTFALYIAAYTVGRFWIESLRIDDAHHILGLRLNDWTALIVFLCAVGYLWYARNRDDEERVTVKDGYGPAGVKAAVPVELAKPEAVQADPAAEPADRAADEPDDAPRAPAEEEPVESAADGPEVGAEEEPPADVPRQLAEEEPVEAPDDAPEAAAEEEPAQPAAEDEPAEPLGDEGKAAAEDEPAAAAAGKDGAQNTDHPAKAGATSEDVP